MKRELVRAVRGPAAWVLAYLALEALFVRLGEGDGLLSPSGVPRLPIAALGLVVLVLRVGAWFGVPAVLAYRAATFQRRAL